jgi:hypothetical protein
VINIAEEDDKPWRVTAATANVSAISLADLAGEDEPAMSLDLEGWITSKGGWGIWNWR